MFAAITNALHEYSNYVPMEVREGGREGEREREDGWIYLHT